jgi:hypothetical protein
MVESGLDYAMCHILTPYPGLPVYRKFKDEGRILTEDLSKYTTHDVVFRPRRMTPDELQAGYDRVVRTFYGIPAVSRRAVMQTRELGLKAAVEVGFGALVVRSNLTRGLPTHP